ALLRQTASSHRSTSRDLESEAAARGVAPASEAAARPASDPTCADPERRADAARIARYAALALAQFSDGETEAALLEVFRDEGDGALRRAALKALATAGGSKTAAMLATWRDDGTDAELTRLSSKARLL